jgi:hypothetical protein
MSTINVTNVKHPSATNPAIVLDADGDATYAGVHDFSAATVTGAPQGLVHINTTTVSTQSTVSFNSVFSATYQNYKIMIIGVGSTAAYFNLRMRVSGTDATGSDYNRQSLSGESTTASAFRETTTAFNVVARGNATSYGGILDVLRPFDATATSFINQSATSGLNTDMNHGNHSLSTSYDGFTLTTNTGTFTGTIRIYGYKNS